MDSKDTNNVVEFPAPGQELYLPFGATDPDFYIPADCDRKAGGFSRWLRALPVFGRQRPLEVWGGDSAQPTQCGGL